MQEYETDYEEEIERLKKEIAKEEGRTRDCQREIDRLRVIVRDYCRIEKEITEPDYEKLFKLWANFDDDIEEIPPEVKAKHKSVGRIDGMSFKGFYVGFAAAAKLFKEE